MSTETIERFGAQHYVLNQISAIRRGRTTRTLVAFEQWLGRDIETATPQDIKAWMTEQVAAGSHVNTVRFRLNMLLPFFRWAWHDGGLIDADTWLRIREIKPPRGATAQGTPRPYKRTEIECFWKELDTHFARLSRVDYYLKRFGRGTTPWLRVASHFRYYQAAAIFSLALYEGLRRHEIFCLSLEEIHPDNAYLVVHGKRTDHRERVRQVPYCEPAREAVADWLRLRKMLKPRHKSPWLALDRAQGMKVNRPMAEEPFNGLGKKIGRGYELHRFRHTFATERLRAGLPVDRLQKILGHARIQTTLGYTELLGDDLAKHMAASDAAFMAGVGRRPVAA